MLSVSEAQPTTTIRARRRVRQELRQLWRYRKLLYFFAWRDLKVRYKQSLAGAAWAVIQPLGLMVVFTVFFGRLAGIGWSPASALCAARLPWTFLSDALTASMSSFDRQRGSRSGDLFPTPDLADLVHAAGW